MEGLLTVQRAAELLVDHPQTLYKARRLPHVRTLGGSVRLDPNALATWLRGRGGANDAKQRTERRGRRVQDATGGTVKIEHAKIDPRTLRVFTGVYLFSGLFKFTVTENNGKLYVQYPPFGEQALELLAESDSRFFTTSQPFVIEFQREADGSIKKAKARNGPEDLEGEKISDTR
jgi:hypothetical protein